MKKNKLKIKIITEILNLRNLFINKFKKYSKFRNIKYSHHSYIGKFNKFKSIKFTKISNLNLSIILFVSSLFLYLFYLSVPTFYDKDTLQKNITNKLIKEFNINFSLSSNIRYLILPSPHILIENVKIFDGDLKNPKELSQIKKLKVFISQKNLFDQNKLTINKISIENANFLFQNKYYDFYNEYLKNIFSKKKIIIKKSNFFFKDKNGGTISLFPIKNINLFYDTKKLVNQITIKGKFFKIPFYLNWKKKLEKKTESSTIIKLKKLDLEIKNESFIKDQKYLSRNNITFRNAKLNSNFQIQNNLISFNSENSRIVNSNIDYKGKIDLNPFNIQSKIIIDRLNLIKLLIASSDFIKLSNLDFLLNKNLSAKIEINLKNIQNKLFDFSKIIINIDNGKINLNDSILVSEKVGSVKLSQSKIDIIDNKLVFKSSFIFNVINQDKFYTVFQIPKKNRKLLKNIFFDLSVDLFSKKLIINNFRINSKKNISNDAVKSIINQHNNSENNKIQNWINLKNFTREIFNNYLG